MRVLVVVPVVVIPPGIRVRVHEPVGNPLKLTLPVATEQVGWVIPPMPGAFGVGGGALITAGNEGAEVQPSELLTVKV